MTSSDTVYFQKSKLRDKEFASFLCLWSKPEVKPFEATISFPLTNSISATQFFISPVLKQTFVHFHCTINERLSSLKKFCFLFFCSSHKSTRDSPVCWQRLIKLHLSVHPQPTFSSVPRELHQHVHDHYYRQQRSNPEKTDRKVKDYSRFIIDIEFHKMLQLTCVFWK